MFILLLSSQFFHRFNQHKRLERTKSYDAIFCYLPNQAYSVKSTHTEVVIATHYCLIWLLNYH